MATACGGSTHSVNLSRVENPNLEPRRTHRTRSFTEKTYCELRYFFKFLSIFNASNLYDSKLARVRPSDEKHQLDAHPINHELCRMQSRNKHAR